MRKSTVAAVAIGAVVLAGAAAAISAHAYRGERHGGAMGFGDDGRETRGWFGRSMTKDAFDTRSRERFARLDRNSDGVIDRAEMEAALASRMEGRKGRHGGDRQMGQRMLRLLDANRDGKVTKEEARAEMLRRFAWMDLNSDGRIDDSDLPPLMRDRNALGGDAAGLGHGAGRGMGGFGLLRQIDANKDGIVTREETEAFADRELARLDRNKDGTVDQADAEALRAEMTDYRVRRFAHSYGAGADGRVTREQFQAKAAERFARMDLNGDGTISRDELPGRARGWHGGHHMRHGDGHGHGDRMRPRDGDHGPARTDGPPAKN